MQVLITAGLGVRSHFRFARLLQATRLAAEARAKSMKLSGDTSVTVIARLEYFRDMNVMLVIVLMLYGASLVILCADGLTPAMTINTNKFATDLLIANCNMCIVCLWFIFVSGTHLSNPDVSSLKTCNRSLFSILVDSTWTKTRQRKLKKPRSGMKKNLLKDA